MIKEIISLFMVFVLTLPVVYAQVKSLSLEEKLPNLILNSVINYQKEIISTSELDGKAIIFDFGTTSCLPCIKALPILDSLQKQYSNKLQIFMVTNEPKERVLYFLKNNKIGKSITIPIITDDTVLSQYFRHKTIPHEVWIDKNKSVKAFTDHHYLVKENIDSLINLYQLKWPVKWDFDYDYRVPLIKMNDENLNRLSYPKQMYYTEISSHLNGISGSFTETIDSIKQTIRITAVNKQIAEIYLGLLGKYFGTSFPESQVHLNVKNPARIMFSKDLGFRAKWDEQYAVCFEMTFPLSLERMERNKRILTQLDWSFNLNTAFKKQKQMCWILIKNRSGKISLPVKKQQKMALDFRQLVYEINRIPNHDPLIDEVEGINKAKVLIRINEKSYHDINALNEELEKYGVMIKKEERDIEILTFTDL